MNPLKKALFWLRLMLVEDKKMLIETKRVKNYCSTYKTIILIDKDPFCVCNSNRSAHEVIKRLLGGEIELKDKKIEKIN